MDTISFAIATEIQQCITAEQAFHYRIVPVAIKNSGIVFKTDREETQTLQSELEIILGKTVTLHRVASEVLQQYLSVNYRKTQDDLQQELSYTSDFLEKIVRTAKAIGSSDIHFEPYEENCRIRYRLDGKLIEQFQIPMETYPVMANKIKIRAGLDIAEKRLPQDGRIGITSESDAFDIRVSSLPTLHGEKMVLRILSKDTRMLTLSDLGFTANELKVYRESIRKPNGIVLISGPTGSGKTTTLYATLSLLNDSTTNIVTIEDPIEYTLEGVNQVQLRENIGLDFSKALRTFLRQDPDIIMVGEIRDVKTANMAIRAALTGHLVLSTIHTNSAWSTISRLIDMGIPPFLIASTLNVSVAQRLVRKLCPHCKKSSPITAAIFPEGFAIPKDLQSHYEAVGCNACHYTGYHGRKAIYEMIPMCRELTTAIKNNDLEIDTHSKEKGIATLKNNALRMVAAGTTSVEEVYALLSD